MRSLPPKRVRRAVLGLSREALDPELAAGLRAVEQAWSRRDKESLHRIDCHIGHILVNAYQLTLSHAYASQFLACVLSRE